MRGFQYPVILTREKAGAFLVRFPDFPEAITSGSDRRDALVQASDCLEEAIAGRIVDGLEIPQPSPSRRHLRLVTLPATMAAKTALYLAIREAKMKKTELAQRLGCDEKEVRRMLDPRHPTKLVRIQQALDVLGQRLVVSMMSQEERAA
jgi:antitoxin HicB